MSSSYLRSMNAPSDTEVDYAVHNTAKWSENEETAVDDANDNAKSSKLQGGHNSDDWNYVRRTLAKEKPLPPITINNVLQNINWISFLVLTIVPALAFYGATTTPLTWKTAVWCVVYYFYSEWHAVYLSILPAVVRAWLVAAASLSSRL